jgi:uncharacterized protein (TIGR04255 family)
LFWNEIRKSYPRFEVHPPVTEALGMKIEIDASRAKLHVSTEVPVRCWFIHHSGAHLVQVQNGALIQNWRKAAKTARYLHYDELRPMFLEMWKIFRGFLAKNEIDQPEIVNCEVTYVNHIDRGRGWEKFSDLPMVVPSWSGQTAGEFLPPPTAVSIDAFYPIKDNAGRLEVILQPGVRGEDSKETLQLVLTARCKPNSSETGELLRCLDLGREWVVKGFDDLTSERMHVIWGKRERDSGRQL